MDTFSRFRKWANRDDGRFYRIGNESIGARTAVGTLVFIGALVLWQLHSQIGISRTWATATGVVGLALLFLGRAPGNNGDST